ncbi:cytochrome p450 [Rhizoctonia solani AG-1 IA]|uniref:Cytochrome p450 n=1 Tax=Thanatephorus cucumeris (strain AG1-IA) TaxID=983506 RepID=L8WLC1_THACA|nr:cytochrome p450 [Rhizoctonia solani AG-1 IA]
MFFRDRRGPAHHLLGGLKVRSSVLQWVETLNAESVKGHFSDLIGPRSVEFQDEMIAQYGPTLKLYGGFGEELIFTADPSIMHHVLVKERAAFKRPAGAQLLIRSVFGGGLLAQSGKGHSTALRKTSEGIKKDIASFKGPSNEVDVFPWATVAALELVGEAGLGYSFSSFTGDLVYRKDLVVLMEAYAYRQVFSKMGPFMKVLPYVYRMGTPSFRSWILKHIPHNNIQQLLHAVRIQNEQAEEVIRTRQGLISSGEDLSSQAGRGRDIMTLLSMPSTRNGWAYEVSMLHDVILSNRVLTSLSTFVFAGHETTSTAVARILDILAQKPRVQVELREEIRKYFEKNLSDTNYDGLLELPYLDGVVRETLRLHGPVTLLNRICEEDIVLPLHYPIETPAGKLTSIPIKKGTRVFATISASNRYERIWGERAKEYLPERWIESKIEEVTQPGVHLPGVYSSIEHLLVFNWCLQTPMLEVMIAELIKDFKFEPSQEEHDWEPSVRTVDARLWLDLGQRSQPKPRVEMLAQYLNLDMPSCRAAHKSTSIGILC